MSALVDKKIESGHLSDEAFADLVVQRYKNSFDRSQWIPADQAMKEIRARSKARIQGKSKRVKRADDWDDG